jgi:excisionase family DNA binding protein
MYSLLKPSDVARQLGVSRAWVYDAAKCGRIPSVRIGGADGPLRFVPDDLELWIEQSRAGWTPTGAIGRRSRARQARNVTRRADRSGEPAQQSLL